MAHWFWFKRMSDSQVDFFTWHSPQLINCQIFNWQLTLGGAAVWCPLRQSWLNRNSRTFSKVSPGILPAFVPIRCNEMFANSGLWVAGPCHVLFLVLWYSLGNPNKWLGSIVQCHHFWRWHPVVVNELLGGSPMQCIGIASIPCRFFGWPKGHLNLDFARSCS